MTTRRKMLGGMVAVAAGGSLAGKMLAGGETFEAPLDEASVVMLELSQKRDVGLGNDEDGYWKVERAFGLAPSAHEGEEPAWREVPIPAFRAALRRRAASAAC